LDKVNVNSANPINCVKSYTFFLKEGR